ncbi:MAG: glycosyltransferase family 4 protein [Nitrospirota bacterium]
MNTALSSGFSQSKKVLQIISSGGMYGAEQMLLELSSELKRDGTYAPIVGVMSNRNNPHEELADAARSRGLSAAVFPCSAKLDVCLLFNLRGFLKKNRIGIIHTHGYKADCYAYAATRGLPITLISTCHNWLGDDLKMKSYAVLDRMVLKQFDAVAAVSPDVRVALLKSGIPSPGIYTVQNGVCLDRFIPMGSRRLKRTEFGIPENALVIGSVGRLSPEKGHRVFLEAARAILSRYPNSFFLIVGEGPLKEDLKKEFGSASILFTGFRRHVVDLYHIMDIFVLPSFIEGSPMALLEAMASRTPVIATRVGDIPNMIVHQKTGLLVEPGDAAGLQKTVEQAIMNPRLRQVMVQEAYRMLGSKFSSCSMAATYRDMYAEYADLTRLTKKGSA